MFYVPEVLGRKGPLALVWMAAHDHKRLTKTQVMSVNIGKLIKLILNSELKFSLRISADLMEGICRLNQRQVHYIVGECNIILDQINAILFKAGSSSRDSLSLPEKESVLQDIQLPELDQIFNMDIPNFVQPIRMAKYSEITLPEIITDESDLKNTTDYFGKCSLVGEDYMEEYGPFEDVFEQTLQPNETDENTSTLPLAENQSNVRSEQVPEKHIDVPSPDMNVSFSHDIDIEMNEVTIDPPEPKRTRPSFAIEELVLQPIEPAAYRRPNPRIRRGNMASARIGVRHPPRNQMIIDEETQLSRQEMELQLNQNYFHLNQRSPLDLTCAIGKETLRVADIFSSPLRVLPSELSKYFKRNLQTLQEESEKEMEFLEEEQTGITDMPTENYMQNENSAAPPKEISDANTKATFAPLTTTIEPMNDDDTNGYEENIIEANDDQFFVPPLEPPELLPLPEKGRDANESLPDISKMVLQEVNQTITQQINSTNEVFTFSEMAPPGTSKVKRALLFNSLLGRVNNAELQVSQDASFEVFTDIFITSCGFNKLVSPTNSQV